MRIPRRVRDEYERHRLRRWVALSGQEPKLASMQDQGWSLLWCSRSPSRSGCSWDVLWVRSESKEGGGGDERDGDALNKQTPEVDSHDEVRRVSGLSLPGVSDEKVSSLSAGLPGGFGVREVVHPRRENPHNHKNDESDQENDALRASHGCEASNDPKLSDRRSWRALCMVGVALLVCLEAQGMTAEPVRCSAWLGVAGSLDKAPIAEVFLADWNGEIPLGRLRWFGIILRKHADANQAGILEGVKHNLGAILADANPRRNVANSALLAIGKQQKYLLLLFVGAACGALLLRRYGEFLYLLAQIGVLRFKVFILGLKFRKLAGRNRKLLLENRDLLLKQRQMLALDHGGTVLHDDVLNEGERIEVHSFSGREETPNDPKLSDGGAWRGACPTVARTTDAQM